MNKPKDGQHRKSVIGVDVTPLQPPFGKDVVFYRFGNDVKTLALSKADAELVKALTANQPGAEIALVQAKDPSKIRIRLT